MVVRVLVALMNSRMGYLHHFTGLQVKPPLKCKNTETFPKKIAIEKPSDKTVRYHCRVDGCTRSYKTKADLNVHLASHGSLSKYYYLLDLFANNLSEI